MTIIEINNLIKNTFNNLKFNEELHLYTLNDKQLINTTTFIKQFLNEFNSYHASENKAKSILKNNPSSNKNGTYYRKRWKYLRDEAIAIGSRVHNFAECYPDFDTPLCNKEKGIIEFFKNLPDHIKLVNQEVRVYNEKYLKAGTIDCLLYNTQTNKLIILDWKTNNSNLFDHKGSFKDIFKNVKASKFNEYSIQLSDYKFMLESSLNIEVEDLWICWLNDFIKNDDTSKVIYKHNYYKLYKAIDFSNELKNHIESLKTKTKKNKITNSLKLKL